MSDPGKKGKHLDLDKEHIWFPGGYRVDLLNILDELYRTGPLIKEPWSAEDIRETVHAISSIEGENHQLPLGHSDIARSRRARKLALRSLERGRAERGGRLLEYVIRILEKGRRFEEHRESLENRRYRARQSDRGKQGGPNRWGGDAREEYAAATQRLARMRDAWGEPVPPAELWPLLFAELDNADLAPAETAEGIYEVSGLTDPITFEGFRKQIQRARKPA